MSEERATSWVVGPAGGAVDFTPARGSVKLDRERSVTFIRRRPDRAVTASGVLITKYSTQWEVPIIHDETLAFLLNALSDTGAGTPWTFHRPGAARLIDALASTDDGLNLRLSGGVIQDLGFSLDVKNVAQCTTTIRWQSCTEETEPADPGEEPVIKSVSALNCEILLDGDPVPVGGLKFTLMRDLEPAGYDSDSTALSLKDHAQVDLVGSINLLDWPGFDEMESQREADLQIFLSNGTQTLVLTAVVRIRSAGRVIVGTGQTAHQMEFLGLAPFTVELT